VKRRPFPTIGRFHLDQPIAAIGVEAQDIIAGAVAIDMSHPADALGDIGPAGSKEAGTLMGEDALFAGAAQGAIVSVALGDVVFPGDSSHQLKLVGRRRIAVRE